MDQTYAMIPVSEDAHVKLYREKERKYHVEDPYELDNEYICETDNLGNHAIYANYLIPIRVKANDEEFDQLWRMSFDGAYSKAGKGAAIVITSPSNKKFNFANRLEFDASNNVAEYEALLLGLEIAKDMAIHVLSIKGDSDLIISQVKSTFACKSERLKKYRNATWDTMNYFRALNLVVVPPSKNCEADKLVVATSTLEFTEELVKRDGKFEINFRPSVSDNLNNWQVFKDNSQIVRFINSMQEFSDCQINFQDEKNTGIKEEDQPMNHIPKNAIEWESTFDRKDRYKKKETIKPEDFIEINISTDKEPRNIKIGKGTSKKE